MASTDRSIYTLCKWTQALAVGTWIFWLTTDGWLTQSQSTIVAEACLVVALLAVFFTAFASLLAFAEHSRQRGDKKTEDVVTYSIGDPVRFSEAEKQLKWVPVHCTKMVHGKKEEWTINVLQFPEHMLNPKD
ncbi:MAG: hypothetical protein WEC84_04665 [Candidatus Andersenbacteria bacterium]